METIEIDNIYTLFISAFNKPEIVGLIWILVIGFSFWYLKKKAKSGFFIANWFWCLILKSKSKTDETLLTEILDIEKFNFIYNTNATSKRQINKFEGWVRKYELDFRLIAKLGPYFDIDKLTIKEIPRISLLGIFMLIIAIMVLIIGPCLLIVTKPAALVKMKETEELIWLSESAAGPYQYLYTTDQWLLTAKECTAYNKEAQGQENMTMGLTPLLKGKICNIYESSSEKVLKSELNSIISEQRAILSIIILIFVLINFFLFRALLRKQYARDGTFMIMRQKEKYAAKYGLDKESHCNCKGITRRVSLRRVKEKIVNIFTKK